MLNHIVLIGRLTADPELRYTAQGIPLLSFVLAVPRDFISIKGGGERKTDFIDIDAWRGAAEFIAKYFRKGDAIFISGTLNTSTYMDIHGKYQKRYKVIVDKVDFVSPKNSAIQKTSAPNLPVVDDEIPPPSDYDAPTETASSTSMCPHENM